MEAWKFTWTPLNPGYPGAEVVYCLGSTGVARLIDRLDGSWFARLDTHLPDVMRVRPCTSYEAGRRGIELWAARHEARLRRELEEQREAYFARTLWRPKH